VVAKDVKGQFNRLFNHEVACTNCHNTHTVRTDTMAAIPPEASYRLQQVSRVAVLNGAPGTRPLFTSRAANDPAPANEYEICFKCHSSFVPLTPGQPDLAVLTNPNNTSFHPIQARGRNSNISYEAFEDGWSWDSLLFCSDCHGSDDALVNGPHGSAYEHILKRRSFTSSMPQTMAPEDLCFTCHRWSVYGDGAADGTAQRASRFNDPGSHGHAWHVGLQRVPCYACHVTHGSVSNPALIATGRTPGIMAFTHNAGGGTCTPTCHASRTWQVNYAR
jgi:hypothetical protein